MGLLEKTFLGLTLQQWLITTGIIAGSFALLTILLRFVTKRLKKVAETTETRVDDLIVELLSNTKPLFLLVLAFYLGSLGVALPKATLRWFNLIVVIVSLLQAGLWGNAIISFVLNRTVHRRLREDAASATMVTALGFMGRLIFWSVILLLVLDNLGVNITGLAAGLGIGGIAIALALQNVLGDLFASLSIVLDKPFVIGDFIIVDQFLGTVEHIGLKTTRIRSLSGEEVIFSNTDLLKSRIRNYKRMFERRVAFSVGITYQIPGEKLRHVSQMLRSIVEAQSNVRFDRAHFKEFGDSALVYEVVYYVRSSDFNLYMDIQQSINLEIVKQFKQEGIEFAYPTRTVFIQHQGTE
ncbi:MAG: mechanosensitive ion channel family protein [Ignavibacteriales bacterium]|nr:mechanosensitive ion channel family protein [Ignavibacteriales bacterium]